MQLLLQSSLQLLRGYQASLLTILTASGGASKTTTDRLRWFPEVSSVIRHSFGIDNFSVYTTVT